MKGLIKKVRENKKGFTLAELLVVVAIVGILVAISIPVFTAQLSKARKATNQVVHNFFYNITLEDLVKESQSLPKSTN